MATIDGNGPAGSPITGITASDIELTAKDLARILGDRRRRFGRGRFAGTVGGALSIAVSIGRNDIDNRVQASITGVSDVVTARTGDIIVSANKRQLDHGDRGRRVGRARRAPSSACRSAAPVRRRPTDPQPHDGVRRHQPAQDNGIGTGVPGTGNIVITARDSSVIRAIIVAASAAVSGGFVAAGASIGVSIAHNLIGWSGDTEQPSEISAFVRASTVDAAGDLTITAES